VNTFTPAVRLRDVAEADLPIFFEHQLDPVAARMADFPSREREPFMAHWAKILGDATIITQSILVEGQVAGNIVSWAEGDAREVGYWIGRPFWGQGVATAALVALLGHVTARPLRAHVAKHNIASRRVLEKCGFTLCGEDDEEYILELGGQ
jgi:RimJ/RimL family protein N-acetyltransferase